MREEGPAGKEEGPAGKPPGTLPIQISWLRGGDA